MTGVHRSQPMNEPTTASLNDRLRAMPSSLNDACRTMEEAADELAISQARGDLAVQNRNHWQQEAEGLKARNIELEGALRPIVEVLALEWRFKGAHPHREAMLQHAITTLNPKAGS
jgi:hypothetical protein